MSQSRGPDIKKSSKIYFFKFNFFNFSEPECFLMRSPLDQGLSWSIAYLIEEEFDIPKSLTASFIES